MYQNYAGIDIHKKYSYITVLDKDNNLVMERKVPNDKIAIQNTLLQLKDPNSTRAAVEATFNALWLVDTLKDVSIKTVIVSPHKMKAISYAKIKTDKIDARIIAQMNKYDLLPQSYIPTNLEKQCREIVRFRYFLVKQRSVLKRKVKNILLSNCIYQYPVRDVFCQKGQKWLLTLGDRLKLHELEQIKSFLDLINTYTLQIDQKEVEIREIGKNIPQVKLLKTIPGIGDIFATSLVSEIGNIHRFKHAKNLTAYAGLNPSVYSSGTKTAYGPITKKGNSHIRYALGEAVTYTLKDNEKLKNFYDQIAERRNRQKARTACMRKLLTYIYIMLKHNLTFQELDVNKD